MTGYLIHKLQKDLLYFHEKKMLGIVLKDFLKTLLLFWNYENN